MKPRFSLTSMRHKKQAINHAYHNENVNVSKMIKIDFACLNTILFLKSLVYIKKIYFYENYVFFNFFISKLYAKPKILNSKKK